MRAWPTQQSSPPNWHYWIARYNLQWQKGTPEVRVRIKTYAEERASIIDSMFTKTTTARYGAALSKTIAQSWKIFLRTS
jgi:hypothetical protein